jgi:hypothetical protein
MNVPIVTLSVIGFISFAVLASACSTNQPSPVVVDTSTSGALGAVGLSSAGNSAPTSASNAGSIAGASGGSAGKPSAGTSGGPQGGSLSHQGGAGGTLSTGNATGGRAGGGQGGAGGEAETPINGVTVSASCKIPSWPSPSGSTINISGTKSVTNYDGKGALHEGTLEDCSAGDQGSNDPIIEVADGGSVKNVIFGKRVGDGIHCEGSCTIENVWFQYTCDDAITMLGGSGKTMTIRNSGFKRARDKTIQHNGTGSTVVIDNVYVETAGKLYRSCGDGCSGGSRSAKISNVTAIGVNQVAGVSTNDYATLSNICVYRTPIICASYQPGSDIEASSGANGTSEGPTSNCVYKATDIHALVDRIAGKVATDVVCTGPNSAKISTSACVAGFETCLKSCTPGSYGYKQLGCQNGKYSQTIKCVLPADTEVKAHLDGGNAASATSSVGKNNPCTSQWAWGKDASDEADYCVCVEKPGYYQASSGWFVWDCQSPWW